MFPLYCVHISFYNCLTVSLPHNPSPLPGSNIDNKFHSNPTSYDYDAPVSEAGDPTDKYQAIRDVVSKVTHARGGWRR